jgi:hypothetical protein
LRSYPSNENLHKAAVTGRLPKKEAYIRGDFARLSILAKRRGGGA